MVEVREAIEEDAGLCVRLRGIRASSTRAEFPALIIVLKMQHMVYQMLPLSSKYQEECIFFCGGV